MLTMNEVDTTGFKRSSVAGRGRSRKPARPRTRWLAAAATAQSSAQMVIEDPDAELRRTVDPILDSWTSLALATRPGPNVPSDTVLVEHAEGLLARKGASAGERARTWVELSTLLAARRGGDARPLPLGRDALAAHVARLGHLIAAPPREAPPRWGVASLGLALLGLVALLLWLVMNPVSDRPADPPAFDPPARSR